MEKTIAILVGLWVAVTLLQIVAKKLAVHTRSVYGKNDYITRCSEKLVVRLGIMAVAVVGIAVFVQGLPRTWIVVLVIASSLISTYLCRDYMFDIKEAAI